MSGKTKRCSKCGEEKPTDSFYLSNGRIFSWCISCHKTWVLLYQKKRWATDPAFREKHSQAQKERYERDPEFRERQTQSWIKYHEREICRLLQKHHDSLREDPDHLTTDFIKKILGNTTCEVSE